MGELFVQVLGPVALAREGDPLRLPPKLQVLLALLVASQPDGATDDLVLDLLYGGQPPASADAAVRVHLAKMRDALEPGREHHVSTRLAKVHGRWRLRLDSDESDVGRLESGLAEAQATRDPTERLALLRSALPVDAEPFADLSGELFEAERARCELLLAAARHDLASALLDVGDHVEAAALVDQALRRRPFDEPMAELRARAHYQASGSEAALAWLRDFSERLVDELGLDATPAVGRTVQRILNHDPALGRRTTTPTTSTGARSRLIGRDEVLVSTRALLGSGQVVCLVGEAGIGKTALLQELARDQGAIQAAASGPTPYSLVHNLLAGTRARIQGSTWDAVTALLRGDAAVGGADVGLMFEALLDEHIAPGTLILVDDAELADRQSRDLVMAMATDRVRLVMALRPVRAGNPWESAAARVIEIPALGLDSSRQLAARVAPGRQVGDDDLARAGGVPLLVEHVALGTAGPGGLRSRVLSHLTGAAERLAQVLAVVAEPFPAEHLLAEIGSAPLEELLVSRVAVDRAGLVGIAHPLVAEVIAADLGPVACGQLLGKVIDWARAPLSLTTALRTYRRFVEAPQVDAWSLRAGRAAIGVGDPELAIGVLDAAVDSADPAISPSARRLRATALITGGHLEEGRAELVPVLGDLLAAGDTAAAYEALEAYVGMLAPQSADAVVVDGFTRALLSRDDLPDHLRSGVLDLRAAAASVAEVEARTAELLAFCEGRDDLRTLLRALTARWRRSFYLGEPARKRLALSQTGVELARRLDDRAATRHTLRNRIDDLIGACLPDQAADAVDDLRQFAHRSFDAESLWWVEILEVEEVLRRGDLELATTAATALHRRWGRMPASVRDEVLQLQMLVAMFLSGQHAELRGALLDLVRGASAHEIEDGLVEAALLMLNASAGIVDAQSVKEGADAILARPAGWRRTAELALTGRACVAAGLRHDGVRKALEPYSGSWVLLGTSAATFGPVDTVLAGLAELAGESSHSVALARSAAVGCERMRSPVWLGAQSRGGPR